MTMNQCQKVIGYTGLDYDTFQRLNKCHLCLLEVNIHFLSIDSILVLDKILYCDHDDIHPYHHDIHWYHHDIHHNHSDIHQYHHDIHQYPYHHHNVLHSHSCPDNDQLYWYHHMCIHQNFYIHTFHAYFGIAIV